MTRDLCYFYPCPLNAVYGAFVQTAAQKLGKDCKQTPMVSISFGLNFSMKYNMNGGACTIHFMPYQNGTAINIRYSVVQLMGARYKKHAQDLTLYANNILRANAQPAKDSSSVSASSGSSGSVSSACSAVSVAAETCTGC